MGPDVLVGTDNLRPLEAGRIIIDQQAVPDHQRRVVGVFHATASPAATRVIESLSMTTACNARRAAWRETLVLGSAAYSVFCRHTIRQSGHRYSRILVLSAVVGHPRGT